MLGAEHDGSWLETVAATPVKLWMDADLQVRFDEASVHKTFGQASQLQVGDNLFSLHKNCASSNIAYRSGVKLWIDER